MMFGFGNIRGTKKRVMLVEDSISMTLLINSILESKYKLECFDNVSSALNWMKKGNLPDFIITDYLLPSINGMEFIDYIKSENLYSDIPVVIITGVDQNVFETEENLNKDIKVIFKPFNPSKLLETIIKEISE